MFFSSFKLGFFFFVTDFQQDFIDAFYKPGFYVLYTSHLRIFLTHDFFFSIFIRFFERILEIYELRIWSWNRVIIMCICYKNWKSSNIECMYTFTKFPFADQSKFLLNLSFSLIFCQLWLLATMRQRNGPSKISVTDM